MADDDRLSPPPGTPDWDAIARYLADEDAPDARAAFEAELRQQPEHAALVAALDDALVVHLPPILTAAETDAALASVRARRDIPKTIAFPMRRSRLSTPLRAAAALLLVLGGTLVWRQVRSGSTAVTTAPQHFATHAGQLDSLRLPDGTRVILGPASSLHVPAGYGSRTRDVALSGDALFDVVHDATHPFVVRTATAELQDVGTSFVVRSDAAGEMRVTVTSGAVRARRIGAPDAEAQLLAAGDRAVLPASGAMVVTRGVDTAQALAFTHGDLVFRDAEVAEVAAEMRRWYGVDFRVSDPTLSRRRVTASFRNEPVADVARVIAATLGGSMRMLGDTVWVMPPGGAPAAR